MTRIEALQRVTMMSLLALALASCVTLKSQTGSDPGTSARAAPADLPDTDPRQDRSAKDLPQRCDRGEAKACYDYGMHLFHHTKATNQQLRPLFERAVNAWRSSCQAQDLAACVLLGELGHHSPVFREGRYAHWAFGDLVPAREAAEALTRACDASPPPTPRACHLATLHWLRTAPPRAPAAETIALERRALRHAERGCQTLKDGGSCHLLGLARLYVRLSNTYRRKNVDRAAA